jgi:hypothetical protein
LHKCGATFAAGCIKAGVYDSTDKKCLPGRTVMADRGSLGIFVFMAAMCVTIVGANALDDRKGASPYPDLRGKWDRAEGNKGEGRFDPTKPPGRLQEAPLTVEYQALYEANLADKKAGGQGSDPTYKCLPPGMPRIMHAYAPMEVVVTPETTYILMEHIHDNRRIHTDGRDFPVNMDDEPMYAGYSIGRWVDEDGDGRYDALVVETRGLKGPRNYDVSGIPLHRDNQSIIRERIYLDKADPNLLHDEITTIDHALTHPWTVTKNYRRTQTNQPVWWHEDVCAEGNVHVDIGGQAYFLSSDGLLMPTLKNQPPPDLKYFRQTRK